jgi:SNARE protein
VSPRFHGHSLCFTPHLAAAATTGGIDSLDNSQVAAKALEMSSKTSDSLVRSLATLEQAKEQGAAIGSELERQDEVLERISTKVQEVDQKLNRSSKLLKSMAVRVFTDKLIMLFMVVLVLGIIAIIVLATTMPDKTNFRVPDELRPPDLSGVTDAVLPPGTVRRLLRAQ